MIVTQSDFHSNPLSGFRHTPSRKSALLSVILLCPLLRPFITIILMSLPFVMHLIIHMFNTSMIPYISIDQYLNPNFYTIPNIQNMCFFCYIQYMQFIRLFKVFTDFNAWQYYTQMALSEKICLQYLQSSNAQTILLRDQSVEILHEASLDIILCREQITKVLIRLCTSAGWSAPLWFA